MAKQLHPVELTADERRQLEGLTRRGVASARRLRRARMFLLSADGLPDPAVAAVVGSCVATVATVRRRFAAERLGALDERPRPGAAPRFDGRGQTERAGRPVPGPAAADAGSRAGRGDGVGRRAHRGRRHDHLAVHHHRRSHQAASPQPLRHPRMLTVATH
jgi:hypothetical protein